MRFIKKQVWLWRLALIVGGAAIAIPFATSVGSNATSVGQERQYYPDHQTTVHNEDASAAHRKNSKPVGLSVARPQDDYYERRREYWEKRVERRLDEEDLDDETGDDKDADSKDSKDKDSKNAADDEDDGDDVDKEIERRRDYWRKRVERDW